MASGRPARSDGTPPAVRIFDYVDRDVPMLLRMFQRRLRGYRAIGYASGERPVGDRGISDELIVEYDPEMTNESEV